MPSSVKETMTPIRLFVAGLIAAIIAVAVLPMIVLLDLAGGGDGLGICSGGGLSDCRTSYFDGPELLAILALILLLLVLALRAAHQVQQTLERRRDRDALDRSVGGRDGLGRG